MTRSCPCRVVELIELDRGEYAATLYCEKCTRTLLRLCRGNNEYFIGLRHFYARKLSEYSKSDANNTKNAARLLDLVQRGDTTSPSLVLDLGVTSRKQLRALRSAFAAGLDAYILDRVMGDGAAITAVVRLFAADLNRTVEFITPWDSIHVSPDAEREHNDRPIKQPHQGENVDTKATVKSTKCTCSHELRELDQSDNEATLHCDACLNTFLRLDIGNRELYVQLGQFHRQRLGPDKSRDLEDRTMAKEMHESISEEQPMSRAALLDFGVDSPSHISALADAIEAGLSPYALDRVLGDPIRNELHVRLDQEPKGIYKERGLTRDVTLPLSKLSEDAITLGYAATTHKLQGQTVEHAYLMMGKLTAKEMTYTQLTRARATTHLFVDELHAGEELADLVASMKKSRAKNLAHDLKRSDAKSHRQATPHQKYVHPLRQEQQL